MRFLLILVSGLLVLIGGAAVAGHYYVESNHFRMWLAQKLSDSLERQVSFENNLNLAPGLVPQLHISGLQISNPEWASAPYFARINELALAPRLLPLMAGNVVFKVVQASGGEIWLERNDQGVTSWPHPDSDKKDNTDGAWWQLRTIASAEITDFLIATPGEDGLRLKFASVRANTGETPGREMMQAEGTLNGRDLSASWQAPETLWFLRSQSSQSVEFKVKLDSSDVNANLEIDRTQSPPSITGTLQSERVVVESANTKSDGKLIPTFPLPTSWLNLFRSELDWNIKHLELGALVLGKLHAHVSLQDGRLHLDPLDALLGDAPLHMRAAYSRSGEFASVRASGELDDLDLSEKIDWLSGKTPGTGFIDIRFVTEGVGNTFDAVAANLNGNLQLVMEEGQVSNSWLERVTSDLGGLINPWSKVEGQTPVRCLALRLKASEGLVDLEQLVLDTREALILGDGGINLREGSVDIILSPDARSLDLLKLQLPIRISGPLAAPQASAAPSAIITKTGADVFRNLTTLGGLIEEDISGNFAGSSKGCDASVKAYRKPTEDAAQSDDKSKATGKTENATP